MTTWVDRLARITTSGRRIRELDGLRFVAISTVFVQHAFQTAASRWPVEGDPATLALPIRLVMDMRVGVELFFVISGFILAMPFAMQHLANGKPVSLKSYYWRRVTRLEPPYLLMLLLCFATLVFYWGQSASDLAPHLLASALYMHNVFYNEFSTINSVAWSLEIEVQFYILAPLIACIFMIRSRWLRRAALIAFTLFMLQGYKVFWRYSPDMPLMPLTLLSYLPYFLMGFLLADVYLVDWKERPQPEFQWDLAALPGWLLLPFYFQQKAILGFTLVPASALPFMLLALCWTSFRSMYVRRALASSFAMTLGGMCYTIYLLHLPILHVLGPLSPPLAGDHLFDMMIWSALWAMPVLAASVLYFVTVEKPCMRKNWPQLAWLRIRTRLQVARA